MTKQDVTLPAEALEQAEPQGVPVNVTLQFDEATQELSAVVGDAQELTVFDLTYLRELVARQGFSNLYFPADALQALLHRIAQDERGTFPLGCRKDAAVELEVGVDAMTLLASTTPAFGGAPLSWSAIEQALQNSNIDPNCIDSKAIDELVKGPSRKGVTIAWGRPAEDGTDSTFETLVRGVIHHAPTAGDDGNVDPFDISEFIVVDEGAHLMRLVPATSGTDGMDVHGKIIAAKPGKQTPFARDLPGVRIDTDDENLLVAATKGHPVIMANGVRIDEVIKFPSADTRSGDIRFDGSVYVTGDVSAGVEIYASGDVTVKGMVEHAVIEAGGDITVGIGIVNPAPHDAGPIPEGVHLKAAGNIQAKYVSGAWLEAGGNIIAKEYIAHSVTETAGQVLVGQGGGQGRIFGGRCHGRKGIAANRIGSNASVETLVSAGLRTPPHEARESLESQLQDLAIQQEKVETLAAKLQCVPAGEGGAAADETCVKLSNTLTMLEQKTEKARSRLAAIDADLQAAADASITVAKSLRANATLCIHGVRRLFTARDAGGTFRMVDEALTRVE